MSGFMPLSCSWNSHHWQDLVWDQVMITSVHQPLDHWLGAFSFLINLPWFSRIKIFLVSAVALGELMTVRLLSTHDTCSKTESSGCHKKQNKQLVMCAAGNSEFIWYMLWMELTVTINHNKVLIKIYIKTLLLVYHILPTTWHQAYTR